MPIALRTLRANEKRASPSHTAAAMVKSYRKRKAESDEEEDGAPEAGAAAEGELPPDVLRCVRLRLPRVAATL